jgi:hypothetical protein
MQGHQCKVRVIVFSATLNNISVLLVEETTDLPPVTDKLLSHNVVSSAPHHEQDVVVIYVIKNLRFARS